MMSGVVLTAIIGVVTSFCSSLITWLFTKRKYNAEVDTVNLSNIESAIEIYKAMVLDLGKKLDVYGKIIDKNKADLIRVKNVVVRMMGKICTVESCKNRCPYSSEETEALLKLLDFEVDETEFKEEYSKE